MNSKITKILRCLICNGKSVYDSDSEFPISIKKKVNKENLCKYPPAIYSLPNGTEKCLPTLSWPKISFPNESWKKISKATKKEKKLHDKKNNLKLILLFSIKKRIIKYKIKNLKNARDFIVV